MTPPVSLSPRLKVSKSPGAKRRGRPRKPKRDHAVTLTLSLPNAAFVRHLKRTAKAHGHKSPSALIVATFPVPSSSSSSIPPPMTAADIPHALRYDVSHAKRTLRGQQATLLDYEHFLESQRSRPQKRLLKWLQEQIIATPAKAWKPPPPNSPHKANAVDRPPRRFRRNAKGRSWTHERPSSFNCRVATPPNTSTAAN